MKRQIRRKAFSQIGKQEISPQDLEGRSLEEQAERLIHLASRYALCCKLPTNIKLSTQDYKKVLFDYFGEQGMTSSDEEEKLIRKEVNIYICLGGNMSDVVLCQKIGEDVISRTLRKGLSEGNLLLQTETESFFAQN